MLGKLQGPQSRRWDRQWQAGHVPGAQSGALCRWGGREQGGQGPQDTGTHGEPQTGGQR